MKPVVREGRSRPEAAPLAPNLVPPLQAAWACLGVGPLRDGIIGGQLLRPRFGYSAVRPEGRESLTGSFWLGLLAIQLAHEASLLHDDVVDQASTRRSRPTLVAERGVGAALVAGDQLLARAYLAAARTGNLGFAGRFARAVEDTVAGERAQGEALGRTLDDARAREIGRLKSGALFGCALAAGATLSDASFQDRLDDLGRELGLLYQRIDDLLDFCPRAGTGKPPLADLSTGLWTWPRGYMDEDAGPSGFFSASSGRVPALLALADLREEGERLLDRLDRELPHAMDLRRTVEGWLGLADGAVQREVREARERLHPNGPSVTHTAPVPSEEPARILARHGRSFDFASRLMPLPVRDPVRRVYAFCRLVDDSVDRAPDSRVAEVRLDALLRRAREAWEAGAEDRPPSNGTGGADWFGVAMAELREAKVPWSVVERLVEGVRSDLRPRRYSDMEDLRWYTHRVAGVVGLWMAGLAGCRDPWGLEMAEELGHAMQLTNIARDVGADLALGRLYLPMDLLFRHGLDEGRVRRLARETGPVPPAWAAVMEELMGKADAGYGAAFQAIPHLPPGFRKAVAVAARVYQGIHDEIRKNGYDTLRKRAATGRVRKSVLAVRALRELSRAEARIRDRSPPCSPVGSGPR
jgi:15-cis-phytoene synthase